MNPASLLVTLLRFFHSNGRAKDWAVAWDDRGVQIFYGSTDTALRTLTIPVMQCRGSPQAEGDSRLKKKLAEGYQRQGLFYLDMKGRRSLRPQSSGPGPEETATAGGDAPPALIPIYWERYAGGPEWSAWSDEGSLRLRAKALEVLQALHRAGLVRDWHIEAHEENATPLWRYDVQCAQNWTFGYLGGGLDGAGTGQGMLQYTLDAPAPLLFSLAIARVDESITVVDDHSQVLTQVPPGITVEDDVLKRLGLKGINLRERLAESSAGQEAGKWYF